MEFDWRGRLILRKLEEGCTIRESAAAVGITRQAVLKRQNASPDFANAVTAARGLVGIHGSLMAGGSQLYPEIGHAESLLPVHFPEKRSA